MNDQQRDVMMNDLIHAVKVAMYHHQQSGNIAARNALFEEWQEWLVDSHRDVTLIDAIPA